MIAWMDGSVVYSKGIGKRAGCAIVSTNGAYYTQPLGDMGSNLAELAALELAVEKASFRETCLLYTDSKFVYNLYYSRTNVRHGKKIMHRLRDQVALKRLDLVIMPQPKGKSFNMVARLVDNLAKMCAREQKESHGYIEWVRNVNSD